MSRGLGPIQSKMLILLLGGTSMALSYSPLKQYEILKEIKKEWKKARDYQIKRSLESLCKSELVLKRVNKNGDLEFVLTENGIDATSKILINNLVVKKDKKWDKKWRIVMFDIPEKSRKARNALRCRLNKLGFKELQKSVFVYPFDCSKIISKIVSFYKLNTYVRFVVAEHIDNEKELKKYFNIKSS